MLTILGFLVVVEQKYLNSFSLVQAFRSLVDRVGLGSLVPVEYFGTKNFEFLPDDKAFQRFEVRNIFLISFIVSWH